MLTKDEIAFIHKEIQKTHSKKLERALTNYYKALDAGNPIWFLTASSYLENCLKR